MANLNLSDILVQFENGELRYDEDPVFRSIADSLKMGLGVYGVLDHMIKERNALSLKLAISNSEVRDLKVRNAELEKYSNYLRD